MNFSVNGKLLKQDLAPFVFGRTLWLTCISWPTITDHVAGNGIEVTCVGMLKTTTSATWTHALTTFQVNTDSGISIISKYTPENTAKTSISKIFTYTSLLIPVFSNQFFFQRIVSYKRLLPFKHKRTTNQHFLPQGVAYTTGLSHNPITWHLR